MDVQSLVSFLVAIQLCGVLAMSPMMQGMNEDIMRDIMNLRKKIKNHQKTLSEKGKGNERNSVLPAAEIGMKEFFPSTEGVLPVKDKTSEKKKSKKSTKKETKIKKPEKKKSTKSETKITVPIPDVPDPLKGVGVSDKVVKNLEKTEISQKPKTQLSNTSPSTKASEKTAGETTSVKTAQDPPVKEETIKSSTTDAKETGKSTSKSTRRSRRRSRRRKSSSRRSRSKTTPPPGTATLPTPTTIAPVAETAVADVKTTPKPDVVLEPTPKRTKQSRVTHTLRGGPVATMLAHLYPHIVGLLGRMQGQSPLMDPNMGVIIDGDGFFNPMPGPILGQGLVTKVSVPKNQETPKTSSTTIKVVRTGKTLRKPNPMEMYIQQELCSETPSRFIRRCRTTKDCQHELECYSGYCCARSHRHAEMLDNLPEYIGRPLPQRWLRLQRRTLR